MRSYFIEKRKFFVSKTSLSFSVSHKLILKKKLFIYNNQGYNKKINVKMNLLNNYNYSVKSQVPISVSSL